MFRLSELAVILKGELQGADADVAGLSVPEAQKAGTLCIVSDKKFVHLMDADATAYVIPSDFSYNGAKPVIRVSSVRHALVDLLNTFYPRDEFAYEIAETAVLSPSVELMGHVGIGEYSVIGKNTRVGAGTRVHSHVVIGENVAIGENCEIHPGVVIYDNTVLMDNVLILSGAKIGGDGFGFIPGAKHIKIPHKGNVIIHSNVEIGCNTTIDRGTIGATVIGEGTKIDNLVQVAHNVKIGRGCFIASQCGISGSSVLGDYVVMGGQVGLADHIHIGSQVSIAAKSGVPGDLPGNANYGGIPAVPVKDWAKQVAAVSLLPRMRKRLSDIEKELDGKKL